MKTNQISSKEMSPAGVGPKILLAMFPVVATGILLQIYKPSFTTFPFWEPETLTNAGWILTIPGIILWTSAVVHFSIAFPKGKLITTGLFSVSRNPIYVSWILFILPGLAGIFNNWFFLLAALIMYIALEIFVREEETQMFIHFGVSYKQYFEKVGRIL